MPTASINWQTQQGGLQPQPGGLPNGGPSGGGGIHCFDFGETLNIRDQVLSKGGCTKGCTLDASLEHQSKVSQLQMVCNASSLQLSIVQAMNAQEFKWITQIRGTPLPNQPDMYYFRTPEELLTQKLWRLRVKFLFSSTSITAVRIQSLSLSFEKLTRRRKGVGVINSLGGGGGGNSAAAAGGSNSSSHVHHQHTGGPHTTHAVAPGLLFRGSMSTATSTTASMTTTPTGTGASTPCSLSVYEDSSEISSETDSLAGGGGGSSRDGMTGLDADISSLSMQSDLEDASISTVGTAVYKNDHSGSSSRLRRSGSNGASSSGGGGGGGKGGGKPLRRRSSSSSSSDHEVIRNLVKVIDQVVGTMRAGKFEGNDRLLIDELMKLRSRVQDHASGGVLGATEHDLNADIARISSILRSVSK